MKGGLQEAVQFLKDSHYTERQIHEEHGIPLHWVYIYSHKLVIKSRMLFTTVVDSYDSISEKRSAKGKKTEAFNFLKTAQLTYDQKIRFLLGELSTKAAGVGDERVLEAIGVVTHNSQVQMAKLLEEYGDLGDIANHTFPDREPQLLVDEVYNAMNILPKVGNYDKVMILVSLFDLATKDEAKYLCWLVKRRLYLGINSEAIISVVARYTKVDPEALSQASLLIGTQNALMIARKGNAEVKKIRVQPGKFVPQMKAKIFDSRDITFPSRVEVKYDGIRIQFHKLGNKTALFTTSGKQLKDYPQINQLLLELSTNSIIGEGEIVGVDKDGKIVNLYQFKADNTLDVTLLPFEILYMNGTTYINKPWRDRSNVLVSVFGSSASPSTTVNSMHELMDFYDKVVEQGLEGIMIKSPEMYYYPDRRSSAWMKLKPATDTVDAVIIKANYGKGKNAGTFSNFLLAVKHSTERRLFTIGTIGNFSETDLEILTRKVIQLSKKDTEGIFVKPEIVLEISCYEILQSTETTSGLSMRSPRLVRMRWDKTPNDIDTVDKIKQMYKIQQEASQ